MNRIFLCALFAVTATNARAELYKSEVFSQTCFSEGIEGPAVSAEGTLYVVNYERRGTIGTVDADGECHSFLSLPQGSIGNGIRFNSSGHMLIADYKGHNILEYDFASKALSVFAHDDQFNQPNDIAITSDDFLYASDPHWKSSTGKLWVVGPDGKTTLLESGMGTTNGVEVSPGDRYLYVGESEQKRIWRYEILKDRTLSNKTLFHQFDDYGLDGMRVDNRGRLFVARFGKGSVDILDPDGKLVREVMLSGLNPTNVTFGGADRKTVFVTIQDKRYVERFETEFSGRE